MTDDDAWESRMNTYMGEAEKQITALRAEVATGRSLAMEAYNKIVELEARLAASEETVRGLRGFAQAAVALAQHGRGDMPLLVQCRMRGLLDDKGNPTPLMTGAAAGEGEG